MPEPNSHVSPDAARILASLALAGFPSSEVEGLFGDDSSPVGLDAGQIGAVAGEASTVEGGIVPAGTSGELGFLGGLIGEGIVGAAGLVPGPIGTAASVIGAVNKGVSVAQANSELAAINAPALDFGQIVSGLIPGANLLGTDIASSAAANALGGPGALGIGVSSGSTPQGESPSAQANAIGSQIGATAPPGTEASFGLTGTGSGESDTGEGGLAGGGGTGQGPGAGGSGGPAGVGGSPGALGGNGTGEGDGSGDGSYSKGGLVRKGSGAGNGKVEIKVTPREFVAPISMVSLLGHETLESLRQVAEGDMKPGEKKLAAASLLHHTVLKMAGIAEPVDHDPFHSFESVEHDPFQEPKP